MAITIGRREVVAALVGAVVVLGLWMAAEWGRSQDAPVSADAPASSENQGSGRDRRDAKAYEAEVRRILAEDEDYLEQLARLSPSIDEAIASGRVSNAEWVELERVISMGIYERSSREADEARARFEERQ